MRLPETFISYGGGYFYYLDSPVYIHKFNHGPNASYIVGSKGYVPHYTAMPSLGEKGMYEAIDVALSYFKEQKRHQRMRRMVS